MCSDPPQAPRLLAKSCRQNPPVQQMNTRIKSNLRKAFQTSKWTVAELDSIGLPHNKSVATSRKLAITYLRNALRGKVPATFTGNFVLIKSITTHYK